MIQAVGGIHEIYFPFVLMQPALFAVMIGGATRNVCVPTVC